MNNWHETAARMQQLQEAGAAQRDPVGWHYLEVLERRTQAQQGPAQALLHAKWRQALQQFEARAMAADAQAQPQARAAPTSPTALLAALVQEMAPARMADSGSGRSTALEPSGESPRVAQFRRQLRQISVQKRVSKAIAQAPQNAGPINSHMLVLRALELMRANAPNYLQRFMSLADTLLCLEDSERERQNSKKTPARRPAKS